MDWGCPGSNVGQPAVGDLSSHIWEASEYKSDWNRMSRTSLAAQICSTAKLEQSNQPKVPPAWSVKEVSSVSSASHCPVELHHHSWRHGQNYSHYSNLVIAADPLTVCQTKKKCLTFQAKILRISLSDINIRVSGTRVLSPEK